MHPQYITWLTIENQSVTGKLHRYSKGNNFYEILLYLILKIIISK